MVYVLSLGAAFANALTSVLQRMGVESAPNASEMKLSLLTHAVRKGVWLLGFAVMIASFVFQGVALHIGRLSQVQPILTTELLFLVVILAVWFRFKVGVKEWLGAAAAAVGLAGFLTIAEPRGGNRLPTTSEWILTAVLCGVAITIAILLTRTGPRWWRAAMFGSASAVGFAFTASLTKVVTNYVANDWVTVFRHWETYGLATSGVLSVFLAQNAYHAGPIAASQSTIVLLDPLASIFIGISLFGDQLRTAGAAGPLEALSLLIMFVGAASLSRSPLISGMKGDDPQYHEMLSLRGRSYDRDGPFSHDVIGPSSCA
ncbi:MAG: DMT family transporter [Actinobacteria bacterium]|jgi:drug/metabolite transporter (DMT)-like permease|nr:DMT family transporter [Actinomycetota bacterium]MCL5445453.1 DMT family transporter [Actinomycetota bacterium]